MKTNEEAIYFLTLASSPLALAEETSFDKVTDTPLVTKMRSSEYKDITNLCRYIVLRCMNGNPNMMDILCIGKTKDEILPYLMQILEEETFYKKYMEAKNR